MAKQSKGKAQQSRVLSEEEIAEELEEEESADDLAVEDTAEVDGTEPEVVDTEEADAETTEPGVLETEVETPTKPDDSWGRHGLERYEGMTKEQIARDIRYHNQQFGQATNEVGRLRKRVAELEAVQQPPKEKRDIFDKPPAMTEGEIVDYMRLSQDDPRAAVLKYAGPQIREFIKETIQSHLKEGFQGELGQYVEGVSQHMAMKNFFIEHPDARAYGPTMALLDKEENLGVQDRTPHELFQIAKLAEDQDPLYPQIYAYMKQNNMSFAQAHEITELQLSAPQNAEAKRDAVKKKVARIQATNPRGTTQKTVPKDVVYPTVTQAMQVDVPDDSI
jgi:hypothetical protein